MVGPRPIAALAGAAALVLLTATAAGAGSPKGHHRPPAGKGGSKISCNLVTTAQIQSTLGLTVTGPQVTNNAPVTVCKYSGSATPPSNIIVRFQTGESMSSFTSEEQAFSQHGEPTSPISGLGTAAFSSTIGAGSFTQATIEVLKGSTTVLVTAPASIAQVQALVTQILTHI